jgi:hypothetical protein
MNPSVQLTPKYINIGDVEQYIFGKVDIVESDYNSGVPISTLNNYIAMGESKVEILLSKFFHYPFTLDNNSPLYPQKLQLYISNPKYSSTIIALYDLLVLFASIRVIRSEYARYDHVRGTGFIENVQTEIDAFVTMFNEQEKDSFYSRKLFRGLKQSAGMSYDPVSQGAKNAYPFNPNYSYEHFLTHQTDTSQTWYNNTRFGYGYNAGKLRPKV